MPANKTVKTGIFGWADLATSDVRNAADFYSAILDWEFDEIAVSQNGSYWIASKSGLRAAGIYPRTLGGLQQGHNAGWTSYICVQDLEQTVANAARLGGRVVVAATGEGEHGRVATLADPTGAVFNVWQYQNPHQELASIYRAVGGLVWNELATYDLFAAAKFYTGLFDWSAEEQESDLGHCYVSFMSGQSPRAGMLAFTERDREHHPNWLVYFGVDDCDLRAARAERLGAKIIHEPQSVSKVGRFAVLVDQQGATFAIIALDEAAN